ncbi:hypothetical protein GCM10010421_33670 [Streptomyces glaucus]|uniref:Secreted protein n=1 Tax=Streptomyces glaucus TaxID=284029 RepID=A0ABP5WZ09_9ACTN
MHRIVSSRPQRAGTVGSAPADRAARPEGDLAFSKAARPHDTRGVRAAGFDGCGVADGVGDQATGTGGLPDPALVTRRRQRATPAPREAPSRN